MKDKIHIALAANEAYRPGLELTRASIVASCSDSERLEFHIFDESVLREGLTMTYLRLWLPTLLPEVDKVIWSDVDVLWKADVCKLWDSSHGDALIWAVRDGMPDTETKEREWFARNGYRFDAERYFCAGIMVMNLKGMRECGFVEKSVQLAASRRDVNFVDQSILNALWSERVSLLDRKWNVFSQCVTVDELRKGDVVVHYAGETPWILRGTLSMLTDTRIYWAREYARLLPNGSWHGWTTMQYIVHRGMFVVATTPVLRNFLWLVLLLSGRVHLIPRMKIWSRRLDV